MLFCVVSRNPWSRVVPHARWVLVLSERIFKCSSQTKSVQRVAELHELHDCVAITSTREHTGRPKQSEALQPLAWGTAYRGRQRREAGRLRW